MDKFAVRGIRDQHLDPPEELMNKNRAEEGLQPLKYKNLDTGFSKLDTSMINFYSYQWDNFIAMEYRLKGAIPDGLIQLIN